MLFHIMAKKKGMFTVALGHEVGVEQKTAWLFKRKVQQMMKGDENDTISGNTGADEFLPGGYHVNEPGRSLECKQAVLIVSE